MRPTRSISWSRAQRRRARTLQSSGSWRARPSSARLSYAWPTATQRSSSRSRFWSQAAHGSLPGIRRACSPCSWWLHPCPLILAAPIALVSGLSRAARIGVIVKGAGVIEQLGRARTVLFDKTGTLTLGSPEVERIVSLNGVEPTEALRLAASLDQLSAHVMAEALVHDAESRGLPLSHRRTCASNPAPGLPAPSRAAPSWSAPPAGSKRLGFAGARVGSERRGRWARSRPREGVRRHRRPTRGDDCDGRPPARGCCWFDGVTT